MIDRSELNELLTNTQIVILHRIKILSEAAGLLDDIKLQLENSSDEYLMFLIQNELQIRKSLNDCETEFDVVERDLWNKMLHIDQ